VLELKAFEDIHLVMQAVDYWLRVRWHHDQDDFRRFGYFPDTPLKAKPPLSISWRPDFGSIPPLISYYDTYLGDRGRARRAGGKLAQEFAGGIQAMRP